MESEKRTYLMIYQILHSDGTKTTCNAFIDEYTVDGALKYFKHINLHYPQIHESVKVDVFDRSDIYSMDFIEDGASIRTKQLWHHIGTYLLPVTHTVGEFTIVKGDGIL